MNGTFDRNASSPRLGTPHARAVPVPQGKSSSPNPAATPDDRQAEYFLRLLIQSRQAIEQRIDAHQKAIAAAEACGNLHDVRRHRQLTLTAEQDRRTVADLIDNLGRRFRVPPRVRPVR
ncbi:hypothetical protein AWC00_10435 [Mycobacterium conspicuum]|nr:hypothetical protein AWC00_10435 [Mycobacterium conspicuum]